MAEINAVLIYIGANCKANEQAYIVSDGEVLFKARMQVLIFCASGPIAENWNQLITSEWAYQVVDFAKPVWSCSKICNAPAPIRSWKSACLSARALEIPSKNNSTTPNIFLMVTP